MQSVFELYIFFLLHALYFITISVKRAHLCFCKTNQQIFSQLKCLNAKVTLPTSVTLADKKIQTISLHSIYVIKTEL